MNVKRMRSRELCPRQLLNPIKLLWGKYPCYPVVGYTLSEKILFLLPLWFIFLNLWVMGRRVRGLQRSNNTDRVNGRKHGIQLQKNRKESSYPEPRCSVSALYYMYILILILSCVNRKTKGLCRIYIRTEQPTSIQHPKLCCSPSILF